VLTITDALRSGAPVAFGAVKIELPTALAVVYVLAILIWYELIRAAIVARISRPRREPPVREEHVQPRRRERQPTAREDAVAELEAALEADPARRHYLLARRTAADERDAAVDAASRASMRAIERIERLHREIAWALDHEEGERIGSGSRGAEAADEADEDQR
jgi:hypothetical protein